MSATKPQPPDYDRTLCTSDICDSTRECARHISHYQFDPDRRVWLTDFTNLVQECEHFEPLPEAKP
jgi:hypothetical protein